jgi:hypothetical protein
LTGVFSLFFFMFSVFLAQHGLSGHHKCGTRPILLLLADPPSQTWPKFYQYCPRGCLDACRPRQIVQFSYSRRKFAA